MIPGTGSFAGAGFTANDKVGGRLFTQSVRDEEAGRRPGFNHHAMMKKSGTAIAIPL
jgi:hypothetical protein